MSFYISDDNGNQILAYQCGGAQVTLNDIVKVEGFIVVYYSTNQIVSGTSTILEEGVYEEPSGENVVVVNIADYADANSWVEATQYLTATADEYTTFTFTGTNNTGKYYVDGEQWRMYQTESATFTISSTKTIAKVVIEYVSNKTGCLTTASGNICTGVEVEVNGASVTFGIGNTTDVTNGQVRITKITIFYAD